MLKETFIEAIYEIWPMLFIFFIIISSVRIAFLICKKKKIILWQEVFNLTFVMYILILFYIVTFQDNTLGSSNFIPFKEMFRYNIGSELFFKNIVGNMILFIPFGVFTSFYINKHKVFPVLIVAFISSLSIEFTQSKIGRVFDIDDIMLNIIGAVIGYFIYIAIDAIDRHLPKMLKEDKFKNLIVLILIIIILFYFFNINIGIWGTIYE